MFSALKNGWSINIFYYLREVISFKEGQVHYLLAAYQGIPEDIIFFFFLSRKRRQARQIGMTTSH